MSNKRWNILPVVHSRPFASKAVFWAILKEFEFAVHCAIGELKQLRRPRRQLQKTINLMIKTTALHVHHAFGTFLWRPLHDYDVKPPNLAFYGGREQATTNFLSSFWTWIKSLTIQLQEKSPAFDILRGSKKTRWSLKEGKFIFLATFSLPSSLRSLLLGTVNGELKLLQSRSKNRFWGKWTTIYHR